MIDQLAQIGDWGLWANIATVLTFVLVFGGGTLIWLWRTGRGIFRRPPPEPPLPPRPPTHHISIPAAVPVFGRDSEVAEIHAHLSGAAQGVALVNSGALLAGQGGIGKTTLARHYVTTHGAGYDVVLWTLAATRQNVIDGLCAAAPALGLPAIDQPRLHHAQDIAARIAASNQRWLVVYDNVEDRGDLDGLEPAGAHLLVTTRQGAGWPGWQKVQTEALGFATTDAPAVRLLMDHAGRNDDPDAARALAGDLGGLPLALIVMGAYLRDQGLGFAEGRARLGEVLHLTPANAGYPDSLMGALRLSYDKLPPDAQLVARLLGYWAPEGLGPSLLLDGPEGQSWGAFRDLIPEPVQTLVQDQGRVRAAFTALAERSLITGTGDGRVMHRMTAAALRDIDSGALAPGAVALLAAVYPYDSDHSGNYPICARLTPHVLAMLDSGAAPPVAAWEYLLNQAGLYLSAIADYPGRLPLAQANLASKQQRGLPESDRSLAVAHANLGVAWQRLGDWAQAERELTQALALNEQHHPGSAHHADTLDLLGGLMLDRAGAGQRDRLDRAIRLRQQALVIRRRVAGRRSHPVAAALNNLGTARSLQGRKRAAARLIGAALSIWRDILPPGDARLAFAAMNVGAGHLESGDAAQAEPLLREALTIREAAFAAQPRHPDRRNAAGWLILCLLVRARAGVNRGLREAEARRLCAHYGIDFDERLAKSRDYPGAPTP